MERGLSQGDVTDASTSASWLIPATARELCVIAHRLGTPGARRIALNRESRFLGMDATTRSVNGSGQIMPSPYRERRTTSDLQTLIPAIALGPARRERLPTPPTATSPTSGSNGAPTANVRACVWATAATARTATSPSPLTSSSPRHHGDLTGNRRRTQRLPKPGRLSRTTRQGSPPAALAARFGAVAIVLGHGTPFGHCQSHDRDLPASTDKAW